MTIVTVILFIHFHSFRVELKESTASSFHTCVKYYFDNRILELATESFIFIVIGELTFMLFCMCICWSVLYPDKLSFYLGQGV